MAETVRDVLIRFRVAAPNMPSVGGMGGGVGGMGGGPSLASPLSSSGGVGGAADVAMTKEDANLLRDAIEGLASAVRDVAISVAPVAAWVGLSRTGQFAGRAAMTMAGARISSRLGTMGAAAGGATVLGAVALPVSAFAAEMAGSLTESSLESGDPSNIWTGQTRAIMRGLGYARRIPQIPGEIRGRFERRAQIEYDAVGAAYNWMMGGPRWRTQAERNADVRRERMIEMQARVAGFGRAFQQEAGGLEDQRFMRGFSMMGMTGAFTLEQSIQQGQQRLGLAQAAGGSLQQQIAGMGQPGTAQEAGQLLARRVELERLITDQARERLSIEQQNVAIVRRNMQEVLGIGRTSLMMSPGQIQRAGDLAGRLQAGEAVSRRELQQAQVLGLTGMFGQDLTRLFNQQALQSMMGFAGAQNLVGPQMAQMQQIVQQVGGVGGGAASIEQIAEFLRTGWQDAMNRIVAAFEGMLEENRGQIRELEGFQAGQQLQARDLGDAGRAQAELGAR